MPEAAATRSARLAKEFLLTTSSHNPCTHHWFGECSRSVVRGPMSGKGAFGPYLQVAAPRGRTRPRSVAHRPGHQVIVRALLSCQISVPADQVIAGYRADGSIVTRS